MIVTLAEAKTYVGEITNTYDTFLTEQILIVQEAIEGYCKRKFEEADYKETFYRDEWSQGNTEVKRELPLSAFPVSAVTLVKQFSDEDSLDLDQGTDITSSVRVHESAGILRKRTTDRVSFFYGSQVVQVSYTGGYDSASMPLLIKEVLLNIVSERYNKKISGVDLSFGSDVQRVSIPGAISIDFDYSLSNNTRQIPFGSILGSHVNILDNYRSERAVFNKDRLEYVEVV